MLPGFNQNELNSLYEKVIRFCQETSQTYWFGRSYNQFKHIMKIEDIVLRHDTRGISSVQNHLPINNYVATARFLLDRIHTIFRPAIITTGFYIHDAKAPETDGPPGALAIGKALNKLGTDVFYISDRYTTSLFSDQLSGTTNVIEFPITDHQRSREFAQQLINDIQPSIIISIERCGLNADNKYLNMAGKDITDHTAKIDHLFLGQKNTIGIGDGGNEIGMGNLARQIAKIDSLPNNPSVTRTRRLLLSSVSNWGGYGLVAAISDITKRNLLPSVEWEKNLIRHIVERGAVDGISGKNTATVDNLCPETNAWALTQLNYHADQICPN